jgi:hypothetical protein
MALALKADHFRKGSFSTELGCRRHVRLAGVISDMVCITNESGKIDLAGSSLSHACLPNSAGKTRSPEHSSPGLFLDREVPTPTILDSPSPHLILRRTRQRCVIIVIAKSRRNSRRRSVIRLALHASGPLMRLPITVSRRTALSVANVDGEARTDGRLGSIQLTLRLASAFGLCRDIPRISADRLCGPVPSAA